MPGGKRVLLLSGDILPFPGFPTTGAGLRAWGLGKGLESRGHHVFYSMPAHGLNDGRSVIASDETKSLAWHPGSIRPLLDYCAAEVVVACGWPVLGVISDEQDLPIALDQHGPHILERHFQHFGQIEENIGSKLGALRRADFFTCAGDKQRLYFLPYLMEAGYDPAGDRYASIPVSLSPDMPEHMPAGELSFVYGGVYLPWQDPSLSLTVLVEELERRAHGRLLFFGGKHPVHPVEPGVFEELKKRLELSPRVVLQPMQPHDKLLDAYRHAHIAIDLMARNAERELAFTTRTVEYLWCGLPVLYNNYSELSTLIRAYGAGWTLDPGDANAIRQVISDILDRPEVLAERGCNAQRLIREQLTWDRTIEPLDQFVRSANKRARRSTPAPIHAPRPNKRTAGQLVDEAILHYRRGGLFTLASETASFLKRRMVHH